MSGSAKFNVGELVFAKMKGYPPWPSKILRLVKKVGRISVESYEVYFLGTDQRGTVSRNSIFPYSADFKKKNAAVEKKRYAKRYLNAVQIMEDELFREKKIEIPSEVKKALNETLEKDGGEENSSGEKTENSAEKNHSVLSGLLTRSRSESKTCLVIEKKETNQLKRKFLSNRQPVVKLRRVDDIYPSLKTKETINLSPTVNLKPLVKPKTVTKGFIKIKKTEDLLESTHLEQDVTASPLKEFTHNARIVGQELYRTTQGSPFVIQNVCTVDENFFKNNTASAPSFVNTPDPLSISPPKIVPKSLPRMSPIPPLPPLQPKPVQRNQFGSNVVYLQPTNNVNNNTKGQQYLIVQPNPPPPALKPIKRSPQKKGKNIVKKPMKCVKLRNYIPPLRHIDHDYIRKLVKTAKTAQKNVALQEKDEEEEEEIFKKLRNDIFEPPKRNLEDPLDISEMQKAVLDNPHLGLSICDPDVVVKEEPRDEETLETELVTQREQILEDTAAYNCTKCKHTFSRHSFERHKCGTLQFDDINSINIHNTLKSVIAEQNWHNRKIFFTCSVCQKNCHNVEELADHLNEYHRNKPLVPRDPLALDNEIVNKSQKKDVKLMVCNVLTPLPAPPKNVKSVIKLPSNPLPSLPIPPLPENSPVKRSPVLVCDNTGKQFLLIPQQELAKDKPLDVSKIISSVPSLPTVNLGKSFIFPHKTDKNPEKKVVSKGKATQTVFMKKDVSNVNSDSPCTLSTSKDEEVRYKARRSTYSKKNSSTRPVMIKDFSIS